MILLKHIIPEKWNVVYQYMTTTAEKKYKDKYAFRKTTSADNTKNVFDKINDNKITRMNSVSVTNP